MYVIIARQDHWSKARVVFDCFLDELLPGSQRSVAVWEQKGRRGFVVRAGASPRTSCLAGTKFAAGRWCGPAQLLLGCGCCGVTESSGAAGQSGDSLHWEMVALPLEQASVCHTPRWLGLLRRRSVAEFCDWSVSLNAGVKGWEQGAGGAAAWVALLQSCCAEVFKKSPGKSKGCEENFIFICSCIFS